MIYHQSHDNPMIIPLFTVFHSYLHSYLVVRTYFGIVLAKPRNLHTKWPRFSPATCDQVVSGYGAPMLEVRRKADASWVNQWVRISIIRRNAVFLKRVLQLISIDHDLDKI